MGLAITLRKNIHPHLFREVILHVIEQKFGDEIVLCSGFFQENKKTKKGLNSYQITTDGKFVDYLLQGNIKVTSIGIHTGSWRSEYERFRNNLQSKGISIQAKLTSNYKWHAKIFLLKKGGVPVLGIVGSSNMTKKAFGKASHKGDFNFEADVIMWSDTIDMKMNEFISNLARSFYDIEGTSGGYLGFQDVMLLDYDPRKHADITIQDRLIDLENEINIINLKNL